MVAQRYNPNAKQIFRWRRLFREPERAGVAGRFVPVVVEGAPSHEAGAAAMSPQSHDDVAVGAPASGRMEIVLPDDHRRVIVNRTVDGQALARETLEVIPRRWKVIQTVREKFTCQDCETISQPLAPLHATPRGWAGPNLLATILFEKFGQHQPLNRQRDRYAREGIDLNTSTLADQVGACAVAL